MMLTTRFAGLKQALAVCLVSVCAVLAGFTASAQDRNVSGVILDETDQGIPGAYVVVKGETRGAMTDDQGRFNISVSPDDVLVASFLGYLDEEIVPISLEEIDCFCIEAGKVYAFVNLQKILLKERLYQLEELAGNAFVRINQSCLVRISKIKSFAPSIGGALMVTLENGYQDYVSRRQLRTLKERMGF